jgi:hypothetical protein
MSLLPRTLAFALAEGGACQKLALSTVAVQSAAIVGNLVEITPNIDCYARVGDDPTALSTGVDHFLLANASRLFVINPGKKISFITDSGTGSVKIAEIITG